MQGISATPLVLCVEVCFLDGTLALNITPPPTDRIWYGFRPTPIIAIRAYPKVGQHAFNTSHIVEWLEAKMQSVFEKTLVIPNMDDVVIPFMTAAPLLNSFNI